jgi:hypothetical protein
MDGGVSADSQPPTDERAASQATNGTKAAHTASRPSAIPVAVKYARIVSSPFRSGQDGSRAAITL